MIVFAVMTALLLPVRMVFVSYVTDNWLGSFGLISAISATMIILAKKDKLGKFGKMFSRQMLKLQKGKRAIVVYGESIFVITILGISIFAIEQGNSTYIELKEEMISQNQNIDAQKITQEISKWSISDWGFALVAAPIALVTSFPQMSSAVAIMNESFGGWPLHFYTVGFVECLEFLGILLVYRFYFKTKQLDLIYGSKK